MSELRTYSVFICHDWNYCDEYYRVCEFLNDAPKFNWENLSVPVHDPLADNDTLQKTLRDQIRPADVMLLLAGMYSVRSTWMEFEMQFARRIGTAVIAVKPWSNVQLPVVVRRHATEIIGWNASAIVRAIRRSAPRR